MAPKNRIVTLDDIHHLASNPRDENVAAATTGPPPPPSLAIASDGYYCKPVGEGHSLPSFTNKTHVPLHVIPALPKHEACKATLQRIHDEFFPIIQKRGYNVLSISELCCCGDGLDHVQGRRRKCRKMNANVWGYNQTTFGGGRTTKSHTIHLRLRNPRKHSQLLSWEDVAGTMAHELSHCVHQNHGKSFYKLMEELLEEHAMLQSQKLSGRVQQGVQAGAFDNNRADVGHRLGGNATGSGKSRLLDQFGSGCRLGGSTNVGKSSHDLRRLAARAAEARQKQLLRIRKMIERSKEPCVIEILDDSDDENDSRGDHQKASIGEKVGISNSNSNSTSNRKSVLRGSKRQRNVANSSGLTSNAKRAALQQVIDVTTSQSPTNRSKKELAASGVVIDHTPHHHRKKRMEINKKQVIDLTAATNSPILPATSHWSCERCTYKNQAHKHTCEMCLNPR